MVSKLVLVGLLRPAGSADLALKELRAAATALKLKLSDEVLTYTYKAQDWFSFKRTISLWPELRYPPFLQLVEVLGGDSCLSKKFS